MSHVTIDPQQPDTVILSDLAAQVDRQIEMRISAICQAEWRKINILPNGRMRKVAKQVTYPGTVSELLSLRQSLYSGEDPEAIAATLATGQINHDFETAKAA